MKITPRSPRDAFGARARHPALLFSLACTSALLAASGCGPLDAEDEIADILADIRLERPAVYTIVSEPSGRCLDIANRSQSDGANLQLWSCNGQTHQQFRFEPAGSGHYTIRSVHSGKCLDVFRRSTENAANVGQYTCHGADVARRSHQEFAIQELGRGAVRFVARHSGQALDAEGSGTGNGTNILQWPPTGAPNQRFSIVRVGGADDADAGSDSEGGAIGWASVEGYGRSGTTGGGDASPVTVTNAADLQRYARDSVPRVIRIQGRISIPVLEISSNKTLVGVDDQATIEGGLRIRGSSPSSFVENVIVRNLRINARTSGDAADNDGIHIYHARHVWVDHCEIWDSADGNLDITRGSDLITVSWSKFWYSRTSDAHRFSNLIGASDGHGSDDQGALRVTLHHNWWANGVHERMPRVRFGDVHAFNNYFSSAGNNYAIRAAYRSRVLVENNYFGAGVGKPHEINNPSSPSDPNRAQLRAQGNFYDASVTGARDTNGAAFTPPYPYSMEPASTVRANVMAGAGPR